MYHCVVENFYFSLSLQMKCCTPLHLGGHYSPQTHPKLSKEMRVLIRHNGCGKPKVDLYKLEEEMSNLLCIELHFTRH